MAKPLRGKALWGIVAAGVLLTSGLCEAEEVALEEVVVVATPITEGNTVNRYGGQVTVVREEQISDLNAQDLPSALRMTPGVVISRHNPVGSFGGGAGGSIFIRSMGSSRPGAEIQTLFDGVPKVVGVWTHPLMDVLSIDPISRIEVFKGAQPLYFGNMGFAAVDLIPKRMTQEGFTSRVMGAYGTFNTKIEVAEHGGKIDGLDYYLVQSYRRSDGHRDKADGELQEYFGRMGYELGGNWDVSATFNRTDNWARDPGPVGRPMEAQGRFNVDDYLGIVTISNKYSVAEGHLKLYINDGHIDWADQRDRLGRLFDTLTDYQTYGLRARETWRLWPGGEILSGVDLDYLGGRVRQVGPLTLLERDRETFRIWSPYLGVNQKVELGEGWSWIPSAGFRYFTHSDFSDEFAPQVAMVLQWEKLLQFHAMASRGVNYPGVNVVVSSDLFWGGNKLWKNLKAEKVDHVELGLAIQLHPNVRWDFTAFRDKGRDRFIFVAPPPPPAHFENIEKFETRGIETTLTFTPLANLAFFVGATHLTRDPDDLPFAPTWSMSAGATYRFLENFKIAMDFAYFDSYNTVNPRYPGSRVEVDSFLLLNGKLSYEFRVPKSRIKGEVFAYGENLLDYDYQYKKDYPMPGINGMFGASFKF
jgi:iron complex outermembrane receptor protein